MKTTASAPLRRFNQLLSAVAGLFILAVTDATTASGQTTATTKPVGIAQATVELFAAPLTTAQRQTIHANNFNQLIPADRATYLHAVAFVMGYSAAACQLPPTATLEAHLQSLSNVYVVLTLTPGEQTLVSAKLPAIDAALTELNAKIAGQIAGNPSFSKAMFAGAVCGCWPCKWE